MGWDEQRARGRRGLNYLIEGGTNVTGTVSLSGPAPDRGAVVTLSATGAAPDSVALSPGKATVAAGESTKSFTVATNVVSERTRVVLHAAYEDDEKTVDLDVLPRQAVPRVASIKLERSTIVGGESVKGRVALTSPARATMRVDLVVAVSPETSAGRLKVPQSIKVRRNRKSASFEITTRRATRQTNMTITARHGEGVAEATLRVKRRQESEGQRAGLSLICVAREAG